MIISRRPFFVVGMARACGFSKAIFPKSLFSNILYFCAIVINSSYVRFFSVADEHDLSGMIHSVHCVACFSQ